MNRNILIGLSIIAFSIQMATGQNFKEISIKSSDDSIAYMIGANIGANLKKNMDNDSLILSSEILMHGFKDALDGMDSILINQATRQIIMTNFQKKMQQKQSEKLAVIAAPNKEAGQKFLIENKKQPGVLETPSGLQYKVIKVGKGKTPTETDKVTVNYEGKLLDGTIFDSSFDRNKSETFSLNNLIKGWTEGLRLMKEGGSYELYVNSDLAYGDQGNQSIPGGSTLIFKIDLIKVESPGSDDQNKTPGKKKKHSR
jgi:FKBP-type peptidyl-prolyl cis-trans isomerase